ncbi:hypothetical protein [Helcobacillus massiliensis]|uniref:Protein-S-isoprenylcysteine O-methyltransferase Ste14 n=1 Tax=Helcobacillus massiliensis TaxID=521392 RepID=A0A839QTN7_9MICO|nr:hypothetical protein [Helcobacillus massiliensis]MBB3023843.1 protein-S-isoprenylcysteine O-methyltransferase Ste14 [Helcobacillus massiliensis]
MKFVYRLPLLLEDEAAWRANHRAAWIPTLLCAVALVMRAVGTLIQRDVEGVPWWSVGSCIALGFLALTGSACAMVGAKRAAERH